MLIQISTYLIAPIILILILYQLFRLIQNTESENDQIIHIIVSVLAGAIATIFAALNKQIFNFEYFSLDPFAFILPHNLTVILLILISTLTTILILFWIAKRKTIVAAGIYPILFVFTIYLAFYNLAVKAVAANILVGTVLGIIVHILFSRNNKS